MQPSEAAMAWSAEAIGPGARILTVEGMHDGFGPWRLRIEHRETVHEVVLRAVRQRDSIGPQPIATGAAALRLAEQAGLSAPRLIAADLDGRAAGAPATLETYLPGSSRLPASVSAAQLRSVGAAIARVHAIPLSPRPPDLPYRRWTMSPSDPAGDRRWAALYASCPDDQKEAVLLAWQEATGGSIERARRVVGVPRSTPLLHLADERIREHGRPAEPTVFVHGDVWWGNTRWDGDHCFALIDWKDSGAGSPGVDLGNLRLQMAITYGVDTIDRVLEGWQLQAGRPAINLAYWDAIAGLRTPAVFEGYPGFEDGEPVGSSTIAERRDDFLRGALDRL
ncbi:aminoglycoside phosphotransferase family protein [Microlunatus parietis]|uniref:Aminoglycoside phosphotransferase (APT) family kinase protein n=1 Tax=Microlunatus parietis TaxID=682979 RepID=A0A7Y9I4F4_9ACTN|nr:aminoglycoside phosphotransferase family protein [Microlunatus parietis]NYE70068.1 aminoglycoside phosphotransferase (APT) family kinase protein [Microlunatus parietis]